MKKTFLLLTFAAIVACTKNGAKSEKEKMDSAYVTDSINSARTKYNDSIKILNAKNHFRDLSGEHRFAHSSFSKPGKIRFKKTGRDLYEVFGEAKSGKNFVKIDGEIKMISNEFLNFTGKITQSIQENDNGKIDVRTRKTSFAKKGKNDYWRLQNRVNSSGFTDNIDIFE